MGWAERLNKLNKKTKSEVSIEHCEKKRIPYTVIEKSKYFAPINPRRAIDPRLIALLALGSIHSRTK